MCDVSNETVLVEDCDSYDYVGSNFCSGDQVVRVEVEGSCGLGQCDVTNSTPLIEDCDAYDAVGSNFCLSGDVYRYEWDSFCSTGACDFSNSTVLMETCSNGCTAGVCDVPPADSCFDTDYGVNPYQVGNVSGIINSTSYGYVDFCSNNATLIEYKCVGDYYDIEIVPVASWNATYCFDGRFY